MRTLFISKINICLAQSIFFHEWRKLFMSALLNINKTCNLQQLIYSYIGHGKVKTAWLLLGMALIRF